MPPFITNLLAKPKALVGLAAAAITVLLLITLAGSYVGTRNKVVDAETGLNAKYSDCMNVLSNYTAKIKEALGIADRATTALDTVLSDVMKGRYTTGSTANPSGGSAFSAIVEAYPDLNGVTINYANVQSAIFAGREEFQNCNTGLLDRIRAFDSLRRRGAIAPIWISIIGAPTDGLEARVGNGQTVYGKSALVQMKNIPLTSEAANTYSTGIDQGVNTNPQPTTPTGTIAP